MGVPITKYVIALLKCHCPCLQQQELKLQAALPGFKLWAHCATILTNWTRMSYFRTPYHAWKISKLNINQIMQNDAILDGVRATADEQGHRIDGFEHDLCDYSDRIVT